MKYHQIVIKSFRYAAFIGVLLCCNKVSFSQSTQDPSELRYQLGWDGNSTKISVDVTYFPHTKDSTIFYYGHPELGGQKNIFDIISRVTAGRGDRILIDQLARKIKVFHAKSGIASIHYEIDGKLLIDEKRARPNELFRPVVYQGTFYSLGYNLFLSTPDTTYKAVVLWWNRWPKNMPYFYSLNPVAKPSEKQTVKPENLNNLLFAGDRKLIKKKYDVYGIPYYAVTTQRDSLNNMQQEIAPFFTEFFPSIRDFWGDYKGTSYFICMLPLFNNPPSTATGVNLGQGFIMKYSGPYDDMKKRVIAHETSHTWIGKAIRLQAKGFQTAWFSEGFNDYISVFNLVKAGMMGSTAFLHHLNIENLKSHYTNPANRMPADSIEKHFWESHNYEVLSYQRGFIYAFYLDNQIRITSNGNQNIRSFLVSFFKHVQAQQQPITLTDYKDELSLFIPKARVLKETNDLLLNGQLLDFHQIRLMNGFTVQFEENVPVIKISTGYNISDLYHF
ncbi:M1 family aminopeptidase [Mucilaginibacter phyllosphaerae]